VGVEAESISVGECLTRRCEVDPDQQLVYHLYGLTIAR
jgi:hypothetical protein